jgi:hypothetical protein
VDQLQGQNLLGLTLALSRAYSHSSMQLKSVAHMPWNVLIYRFFNTVIDDLFATIIKMPT